MNKYELKAAYNKIALSDEFKASAKEKLFAALEDKGFNDAGVKEYHTSTSVKLAAKPRRIWKTAAAVCSAAAVVGLAVWGASVLNNRDILSPAQQGSSTQTAFITEQDIELCKKTIETEEVSVLDAAICDLDFDGQDELLLLSSWGRQEIHVFEKSSGEMTADSVFGIGELNCLDKLELYPYENGGERYHYFTFHFDNGGVMSADVLAAIKPQNGYKVEYLLSHGTLSYRDIAEPFSVEFYRKGWSKDDIESGADQNDLSRAEFIELYEKYPYAPPLSEDTIANDRVDLAAAAQDITDDFMLKWEKLLNEDKVKLQQIDVAAVDTHHGSLLFITYPAYESCGVLTYLVSGDEFVSYDGVTADSIRIFQGENDFLFECLTNETETTDGVLYVRHEYHRVAPDGSSEWICTYTTGEVAGEYVYCDIKTDKALEAEAVTYDEYLRSKIKLTAGYTEIGEKGVTEYEDISADSELMVVHTPEEVVFICVKRALGVDFQPLYYASGISDSDKAPVQMLFDHYHADDMPWSGTYEFTVAGYPDVQFVWSDEAVKAVAEDGSEEVLFGGMPIWSVYLSDLNGDGKQEICCGVSFGSGIIDDRIAVYDFAAKKLYELSDRGEHDYYLRMDVDKLVAVERAYSTVYQTRYGELALTETADGGYELVMAQQNVPESLNDIHEFNHYVSAGEVYHTLDMGGGTHAASTEDIREVRLDFNLPLYWKHEWNDYGYLQGAAYFNGVKIFEHARPVHDDEEIDPDSFKTDYVDGDIITVHEEKWGTDDDLFEYYIHTSLPSEYADDGSFDEYKYVVNSGGYNITLTFTADIGLQQETIDAILKSVQMAEQE